MAFQFNEVPDSRSSTLEPPTFVLRYKSVGEQDKSVVAAFAYTAIPQYVGTVIGTLFRNDIKIDPDGWAQYFCTADYGLSKHQTGSFSWGFDTTGATTHIKTAREHIASFPAGSPANPFGGTIGANPEEDTIDGTEIIIPALKLNYTFRHPTGFLTENQARVLARVTGKTNLTVFRGYQPGELLFLGATGTDGTQAEAEVTYQFAASENANGLSYGTILNVTKGGWEYAWVEHKRVVDAGKSVLKPERVHIERLYDPLDFASLLGWA